MIRLRVLGPLELRDDDGRVLEAIVSQPKRLGLLAYLAVAPAGSFCRRDRLLALFWPELDEAHARAALNQAIRFLRKALNDDAQSTIVSRGADEIGVDPQRLWCDASAFREHTAAGRYADALALYRSDLLDGFFLDEAAGFEEWLERERAALRGEAARAAQELAQQCERDSDFTTALASARRAVDLSDLDERRVRELLDLLDRLGDRAGALLAFDRFASRLAAEYAVEPSPETKALMEKIRAREVAHALTPHPDRVASSANSSGTPAALLGTTAREASGRSRARRRSVRVGTGVLGTIALLAGGIAALRATGVIAPTTLLSTGALAPNEQLLVTDFHVVGADSGFGPAVAFAARAALTESRAVTVLSRERLADALRRMKQPPSTVVDAALGREIALRDGVRALVDGQIVRTGRDYDIGMRLVAVASGADLVVLHKTAHGTDEIIPVVDALARDLRRRIGESLRSVRATPALPRDVTSSIEALRFYAQSLRETDPPKSIALLNNAVAADSEFAMAWRRLWIMYGNLGLNSPRRDSALVRAVRYSAKLSETERLLVLAAYHSASYQFVDARRGRAIAIYEQLADSGNAAGLVNLPEMLNTRREFARAESLEIANVRRLPDAANVREGLVHVQVELGKLDEAERMIDSSLRRVPDHWPLQWWKVRMLYLRGRLDAFEHAVDSLRALPDPTRRRVGTSTRAAVALLRGRLREWERLRAEGRSLQSATGAAAGLDDVVEEAYIDLVLRRDSARAIARLQAVVRDSMPTRAQRAYAVGRVFARAGRPDLARGILNHYLTRADTGWRRKEQPLEHRLRGEIAMAEGHGADAIVEVRRGDMDEDGPVQSCFICYERDLGYAFDRAGQADSAIVHFRRFVEAPSMHSLAMHRLDLAPILRRLGELHQSQGHRDRAIHYYSRFVELWSRADPELQPQVAEVRQWISRLE